MNHQQIWKLYTKDGSNFLIDAPLGSILFSHRMQNRAFYHNRRLHHQQIRFGCWCCSTNLLYSKAISTWEYAQIEPKLGHLKTQWFFHFRKALKTCHHPCCWQLDPSQNLQVYCSRWKSHWIGARESYNWHHNCFHDTQPLNRSWLQVLNRSISPLVSKRNKYLCCLWQIYQCRHSSLNMLQSDEYLACWCWWEVFAGWWD